MYIPTKKALSWTPCGIIFLFYAIKDEKVNAVGDQALAAAYLASRNHRGTRQLRYINAYPRCHANVPIRDSISIHYLNIVQLQYSVHRVP